MTALPPSLQIALQHYMLRRQNAPNERIICRRLSLRRKYRPGGKGPLKNFSMDIPAGSIERAGKACYLLSVQAKKNPERPSVEDFIKNHKTMLWQREVDLRKARESLE